MTMTYNSWLLTVWTIFAVVFIPIGLNVTAQESPDITIKNIEDPVDDIKDANGNIVSGYEFLDITEVNITYGIMDHMLLWCKLDITFYDGVSSINGTQYMFRVGNITSLLVYGTAIGPGNIFISGNTVHINFTDIHVEANGRNMAVFVSSLYISRGNIYYDTMIYIPQQPQQISTKEVIEKRVYPVPWNIFGVVTILTFAIAIIIEGMAIAIVGARPEKMHGYLLLSIGTVVLCTAGYISTSTSGTLLGIFNWSEVPLMQMAVAILSAFLGLFIAGALFFIYIIRIQTRNI